MSGINSAKNFTLTGATLPACILAATDGNNVSLADLKGWSVLFFYPRTGNPDEPAPLGLSDVPNAKGCTPQACGFRNTHGQFLKLGIQNIFGISSQTADYQQEVSKRLCLTYSLLSDPKCSIGTALRMRLFEIDHVRFYARTTFVLKDSVVVKVFDDIQDPEKNASEVIAWLQRTNLSELK